MRVVISHVLITRVRAKSVDCHRQRFLFTAIFDPAHAGIREKMSTFKGIHHVAIIAKDYEVIVTTKKLE
jgi:hypothetical protein